MKHTTIYENHKCSTINYSIHENLKILKYTIAKSNVTVIIINITGDSNLHI